MQQAQTKGQQIQASKDQSKTLPATAPIEAASTAVTEASEKVDPYLTKREAHIVAAAAFPPIEWDAFLRGLEDLIIRSGRAELDPVGLKYLKTMKDQLQAEGEQLRYIVDRLMFLIHFPYNVSPVPLEIREIESLADSVWFCGQRFEELIDAIEDALNKSGAEKFYLTPKQVEYLQVLIGKIEGPKYADLRARLDDLEKKLGGIKPGWFSHSVEGHDPFAFLRSTVRARAAGLGFKGQTRPGPAASIGTVLGNQ